MQSTSVCVACGARIETKDGFDLYAPGSAQQGQGYNPQIYAELARLEDRNFWFQARNRLIVRATRNHFPDAKSFLEIGCGTGQVLRAMGAAFPNARLHGSELFVEGLEFARQRLPQAHLMQMDATRIPYVDEFELIGAFDVVEHIEDDVGVLKEIHRALKIDGGAILTVPQHPFLWSHQDEMACHVRRYRRHELESKLRGCGFRILYTTSFISLLLPLLALSRWTMRKTGDDPLREMRVGAAANTGLAAVLRAEYALLSTGMKLPVGGSRLVVAIKDS
ncbi:MAG: class I SAM-dependent methyltransferase [Rhodanobacteraceae bacterium]